MLPGLAVTAYLCAALSAYGGSARCALGASRVASLFGLAMSACALIVLGVFGPSTSVPVGVGDFGVTFRLDPLAAIMFALVAFIGYLVTEYSRNYLAGDKRQNAFMGDLLLTVAAAIVVGTAGNLLQLWVGWVGMSLALHRLLVFYRDRRIARVAARKKFIVARVGDGLLGIAFVALWTSFGTGDIASILAAAAEMTGASLVVQIAALLLAVAAILKSAQFPTHGWITEVMDSPTPVSALLHAGIVNAGGFLLFRFADVVVLSPGSMHLLLIVGGFSAVFGSLVMTTQTNIKATLAWSTIAQMGFMLLQCGFGSFASAGLHLVAHSLYKAHSFLASGTAVERAEIQRAVDGDQRPGTLALLASLAAALGTFFGVGLLFDHSISGSVAIQMLGLSFMIGLFVFLARGATSRLILIRTVPAAIVAAGLYFTLQTGAAAYFAQQVPPAPGFSALDVFLATLILASFAAVALLQILPTPDTARWYRTAYVHLSNGLYANTLFNRLTGALRRDYAN